MVVKYIHQGLGTLAIASILLMMLSTVSSVTGRYLFNSPILGTVELNRTLLVFAVFFTLGYTQLRKQHIRVEMVLNRFPPMPRIVIDGLWLLMALVFMGLITYGSSIVAYKATLTGEYETGVINFPMWPGRIGLAIGCLALALQYLTEVIQTIRSSLRK